MNTNIDEKMCKNTKILCKGQITYIIANMTNKIYN